MGQYERHVFVCVGGETCPLQGDTLAYVQWLRDGLRARGLSARIRINKSGCFDQCGNGPMIVIYPENVWYCGVRFEDPPEILAEHLVHGRPVTRFRYVVPPGKNKNPEKMKAAQEAAAARRGQG